jgi:tetratricopeptide (TPR) repeat protein
MSSRLRVKVQRMTDTPPGPASGHSSSSVSGGAGDVVQARVINGNVYFQYGDGTRDVAPRQLPHGIRVFINRLADLAKLDELLMPSQADEEPLITYVISGTAGVGKTSLALHWANRVRDQFPDGQLYVDLRGYDPGLPLTPDQALEQFLLTLGVPAASIPNDLGAKSSIYRSVLADKKMLIILDNAGDTEQVRPLIPGAGRSLAIVTSRGSLTGLAIRNGAKRTTLETLSAAESVRLLTATTASYRRGDDPAEIEELAGLCAHLPLALRIAAERAASHPGMPLRELIDDLRDRSGLWDALSTPDANEANAVRTVFAWSYRALPREAAFLFCFLGLHPGRDFSQEAAVVLAGGTRREVRNSLGVLEGACLLEARGHRRFQFHDLLRVYAIDQAHHEIPQREQLDAVTRVCEWYLRSAYNCALSIAHDTTLLFTLPPSEIQAATFMDRDLAAQWYSAEKSNLVGAARAAYESRLFVLAWQLGMVLERIYASYNHFQDWRTTSELALAAARELGSRAAQAVMHESLGRLCRLLMQLDEAATHYEEAIAVYREQGDMLSTAKTLNGLAWVYLFAHRLDDARSGLADALAIARELGDEYWTATILFGLGYTYLQLLLHAESDECLADSLLIFRSLNDRLYEAMVLWFQSRLARDREELAAAVGLALEAVDISRDLDNRLWEATALLYLGKAQLAAGDAGGALVSYQRCEVLSRQESDISRGAWALDGAGVAYSQLGRLDDAAQFHRLAIAMFRQTGDRWKLAKSLGRLADALPEDPAEAMASRREAIQILADFPDAKSRAIRSRLLAAIGDAD